MIIDNIKASIKDGMKAKATDKVALLRLVVGSVQQDADESDAAVEKIIRKLIKSNKETIDAITEQSLKDAESGTPVVSGEVTKLVIENGILESFIPKTMSVDEIAEFITKEGIEITGNEGKAMGAVMKALKGAGLTVQGTDVKLAIKKLSP
jgi:uncharacterized protein YqeY